MPPFGLGIKQRFNTVPPGFRPTDLSGCVLWLRADKGITPNGSKVSVWADQTVNGNDFSQGFSANQPLFVASGINSLPSISVAVANNNYMRCVHIANSIVTTSAAERFIVGQSTLGDPYGGTDLNAVENGWGSDINTTAIPYTDGVVYDGFATNTRKTTGAHSPTGLLANPYIYGSYSQASDWRNFYNGVAGFTTATNTFAMSTAAPSILGDGYQGFFCTGLFSEWIVYNRVLLTGERLQVTRYLGNRYNISVP